MNRKLAIVTGGAKGLGLAIASTLVENGTDVIIFDKDEDALNKAPNAFKKYAVDVTDECSIKIAMDDIIEKYEKINILINNAGVIHSKPLINIMSKSQRIHDYEEYKKIIEINMHSVFLMTSLVAEKMILKRTKGVIINISSICAKGNAGQSAYSAAKAGVNAFTKVWSKELGLFGIRVVAVAPGFINTDSTRSALGSSGINDLASNIPLRKLGEDCNVAQLVLSAINNNYISGSILEVNGGYSL